MQCLNNHGSSHLQLARLYLIAENQYLYELIFLCHPNQISNCVRGNWSTDNIIQRYAIENDVNCLRSMDDSRFIFMQDIMERAKSSDCNASDSTLIFVIEFRRQTKKRSTC